MDVFDNLLSHGKGQIGDRLKKKKGRLGFSFQVRLFWEFFLWARLIPLQTGMILLGMSITVISISSIRHFVNYFEKIKFKNLSGVTIAIIIYQIYSKGNKGLIPGNTLEIVDHRR
jgi:hypothetical protein